MKRNDKGSDEIRSLITNFPRSLKCALLDIFYLVLSRSWLNHWLQSCCLSHDCGLILNKHWVLICNHGYVCIKYTYSQIIGVLHFQLQKNLKSMQLKSLPKLISNGTKNKSQEHLLEHTAQQDVQHHAIIVHLGCSMRHEAKRHI